MTHDGEEIGNCHFKLSLGSVWWRPHVCRFTSHHGPRHGREEHRHRRTVQWQQREDLPFHGTGVGQLRLVRTSSCRLLLWWTGSLHRGYKERDVGSQPKLPRKETQGSGSRGRRQGCSWRTGQISVRLQEVQRLEDRLIDYICNFPVLSQS